ncbi:fimbrial biogenesis outer membrane usher protein [Rahnella aceris]|uniref:fimbria/pilus outer membrane usher protein n=1 Tax=Rahnella sp. (strain Y9602) TaxID=2703885 RepID=UPI001C269D14|nr:fimbria/pilus outer membrane usher protein [Rahnella aceris]MBU9839251.1 fimbrial biogenesis outer membrane usher protein [Rahnella aceris]
MRSLDRLSSLWLCRFRPSRLSTWIAMGIIGLSPCVQGREIFDPNMLSLSGGADAPATDLSIFETAGSQAPGKYQVDVYINGDFFTSRQVNFVQNQKGGLRGQLTPADYESMGVNVAGTPGMKGLPAGKPVEDLPAVLPMSESKLDFSRMRLMISVPQAAMKQGSGLVDPQLWQQGMPAFLLNYNVNGNHNWRQGQGERQRDSTGDNVFGNFTTGLNLGPWRARSNMTWAHNREESDRYDSGSQEMSKSATTNDQWTFLDRYVERDIQAINGEMTVGDINSGNTASQVFDGFPYRGVRLMTNAAMMPSNLSSFAPIVSGTANSNAQVTVRQNGNVIYQSWVPPGPFRITDIAGGGAGGDLEVSVKEADGTVRVFTQAYSTLPVMQREGHLQYEVSAGRYRQGGYTSGTQTPVFAMGTLIYGLPHNVTVYGGGLAAHNYASVAAGTGVSMGEAGALSADVTLSRTQLPRSDDIVSGQSYRVRYSKSMLSTGTTMDLAAYRYSTRNFYNFQDANSLGYNLQDGLMPWLNDRRRSSWQIRLSQPLPGDLSLNLTGTRDDYWGNNRSTTSLSAGLGGNWNQVGWNMNYSIDHIRGDGDWPENRQLSLNVSVPMSVFSPTSALKSTYASYTMTHDSQGRTSNQLGLSGNTLDNALSWNASQNQSNKGQGETSNLGMGYRGRLGSASLGYSHASDYNTVNYGLSGGLLAHPYGVTLAQSVNNAVALVHAPGARGVKVSTGDNITTDRWGNAVITNLQTYRRNTINLDPSSLPEGVDLNDTSKAVYPTQGAVVLADYRTRVGRQALVTLMHNGKPVPFGAVVSVQGDDEKQDTSIVGDAGQVYMNGLPDNGELDVRWGDMPDSRCRVSYNLGAAEEPKKTPGTWTPVKQVSGECR